jgi:hypothetical protein
VQFSQKADTSFYKGDSFLLTFGSRFLAQSGSRNGTAYLSVTYENDSVVTASIPINITGGSTLRMPACNLKAKRLEGFFYMSRRDVTDNESEVCILLLNHIQLMRFHHKETAEEKNEPQTPVAVPEKEDSTTTDSLKPRARRLGERPMIQPKSNN